MKKLFTLAALAMAALTATAKDYEGQLTVTVMGTPITQQSTISVDQKENGKYRLSLMEFALNGAPVGDIIVDDVQGVEKPDGSVVLASSQKIRITGTGIGTNLGEVPVDVRAEIRDKELFSLIDIDMLGGINVQFGERTTQIPNSDFEDFHTASYKTATSDEPDHWHSFMSSTGLLAGAVSSTVHTEISNDVRPGTSGTRSVLVTAHTSIIPSIIANGTITTGRMNAGGFTATDPGNHAFLDLTHEDTDANGDPFYTLLDSKPDSLAMWVKFKQKTHQDAHPYATVSAVITDGTSRYQEPTGDTDYNGIIVGRAEKDTIAETGDEWVRISVPFDYDENYTGGSPKAILVTISTNADPGQGSDGDELYVDDFELIYNSKLASLSVKGSEISGFDEDVLEYTVDQVITADDIEAVANGKGASVFVTDVYGDGTEFTVTVVANDLLNSTTYTIHAPEATIAKTIPATGLASFSAKTNVTVPEGVTVCTAKINDDETKVLLNTVEADVIPANTGVLIWHKDGGKFTFSATETSAKESLFTENDLIPTSVDAHATVPARGVFYALNNAVLEFGVLKNGITLGGHLAYLAAPVDATTGEAKALRVVFDELTGITEVSATETEGDGAYYTLQGIKVEKPGKGLYIHNGKKVIIK